ncbi:MAG: hypothetical protein A2787_05395 [Omnitrophica WOR_2 bacterium RIFCSPHIGHO2_01_FULL_48_9]|nr:MAG: hypothetical protein A3D10_08075 [Omnitrophica WOR_2 bacterium RIFCSPHIGHO2_02_FULL_48_11]OGX32299.1 MAG: hypothetical protein A2787_05395 [Omnitrophica WOR_2 bacterium RIFCSPHIGHO2_01_FULL_48_9]
MLDDLQAQAQRCSELIKQSKSISVLTGAGISTGAGIPDFRGPQGLYVSRQYDPDKVFDINYFLTDPKPFFDFARDFITLEAKIKPTFTHRFLSDLESQGKLKGIITQNIDALHQQAGSENVLELHGNFLENFCIECDKKYSYEFVKDKITRGEIPYCVCGGVIKPDVVFFGENVKFLEEAYALAESVDLFLIIGTSCVVYPAATIPSLTTGKVVVVNQQAVAIPSANIVLSVQEDIDRFFQSVAECLV